MIQTNDANGKKVREDPACLDEFTRGLARQMGLPKSAGTVRIVADEDGSCAVYVKTTGQLGFQKTEFPNTVPEDIPYMSAAAYAQLFEEMNYSIMQ